MNFKWTLEKLQQEALKYKTRGEFRKKSYRAYDAARERKLLDQICSHMEDVYLHWTDESLTKEALKYDNVSDFYNNSPKAYHASIKRGIWDKITAHMSGKNINWTDEMLQIEALKYKTRWEFQKNSSAYGVAKKRGILDKICAHMKFPSGSSLQEKELFNSIKSIYPGVRKLRDRKVKIKDKNYIKGFDIDIFVNKLGIEFDGEYYHSYKYMRADPQKALWSDDDIENYHKLKDEWFASKGIKILHIKEADWNKNKEVCINKCLDFLYK